MATRDELYKRAKDNDLDVNSSTKKADLEAALRDAGVTVDDDTDTSDTDTKSSTNVEDVQPVEEVTVNENRDGEATRGTTKDGDTSKVTNRTKIPQNGATEVETFGEPQPEDEARTASEVKYADEGNPNQKARKYVPGQIDEDGSLRTGGKSYGVSSNDPTVTDKENPNG